MQAVETLVDALHLEDLANAMHPSVFDQNEAYDMLIIRLPEVGTETLSMHSYGIIYTADSSYLYNKKSSRFELLSGRFEGAHKLLDAHADKLLHALLRYQDQVTDMEATLYDDHPARNFMTTWLELKRDILRIERVLMRASQPLLDFIDAYGTVEGFPINHYVDLHEHIDRITRSAALQLSKLDYLYNFHSARTNERMNRLIYLLTIISAIFLPLNLMVGFFGMNTSDLPFAQGDGGTYKAIALMLFLLFGAVGTIWLLRKRFR